jgi:hypothetical protein
MALLQKAYLGSTALFRNLGWFEVDVNNRQNANLGVTVTANSSAHTKGAWTELIASTTSNSACLFLRVRSVGVPSTNTATLLDIGTGDSGSETEIISNIAIGGAAGSAADPFGIYLQVPIQIPAGTRISARIQSIVTLGKTATIDAAVGGSGDYAATPTSVDSIGGNTATSEGIGMSGSSGTWVEAIASTSRAYRGIVLIPSVASAARGGNANSIFTIGVGASASEVEFGNLQFRNNTSEQCFNLWPCNSVFGKSIPAGSRIAIQHDIGSAPSEIQATLIGIP